MRLEQLLSATDVILIYFKTRAEFRNAVVVRCTSAEEAGYGGKDGVVMVQRRDLQRTRGSITYSSCNCA